MHCNHSLSESFFFLFPSLFFRPVQSLARREKKMQVGHRLLRDTGIFSSLLDQGCNWNLVICRGFSHDLLEFFCFHCIVLVGEGRKNWVMLLVHLFDRWLLPEFQDMNERDQPPSTRYECMKYKEKWVQCGRVFFVGDVHFARYLSQS